MGEGRSSSRRHADRTKPRSAGAKSRACLGCSWGSNSTPALGGLQLLRAWQCRTCAADRHGDLGAGQRPVQDRSARVPVTCRGREPLDNCRRRPRSPARIRLVGVHVDIVLAPGGVVDVLRGGRAPRRVRAIVGWGSRGRLSCSMCRRRALGVVGVERGADLRATTRGSGLTTPSPPRVEFRCLPREESSRRHPGPAPPAGPGPPLAGAGVSCLRAGGHGRIVWFIRRRSGDPLRPRARPPWASSPRGPVPLRVGRSS